MKSLFRGDGGFAFGAGFLVFGAEEDALAAAGDNLKEDFSILSLPSTATFSSMPTILPSRRILRIYIYIRNDRCEKAITYGRKKTQKGGLTYYARPNFGGQDTIISASDARSSQ